jgi:signal peptide peptidase SppA
MTTPTLPKSAIGQVLSSRFAYLTLEALRGLHAGALFMQEPEKWAAKAKGAREGEIAIIPVMGLITPKGSWYGMGVEQIRAAHRNAMADPAITGIVYDYDTPGGSVYLIDELASEFRADRNRKPNVAIANPLSASAGYYLMAQHQEIMVTPSGEIGSVGVYGMHVDYSGALDQAGVKVKFISAGEGKVDGNPYEPLSPEAEKQMQADIDRYYGMFANASAKGRGVSVDVVRKEWKAKVYGAKEAVSIKMADVVGTLDDAILRVSRMVKDQRTAVASADVDAERIRRSRERLV